MLRQHKPDRSERLYEFVVDIFIMPLTVRNQQHALMIMCYLLHLIVPKESLRQVVPSEPRVVPNESLRQEFP